MARISKSKADLGLLSVTVFWGSTFILSKIVLKEISLPYFLSFRLGIAALVMLLIAVPHRKSLDLQCLRDGVILGIFLFLSYLFQMWGITYITASNAGFITGLNVVLVPLFAVIFFGDHPKIASLIGVALATLGLYFLSGGDFTNLNKGDWLVFVCAVSVTFHVILTGKYAPRNNIYALTAVQLTTIAFLSFSLTLFSGEPMPQLTTSSLLILIYLALFGTVFTFLMQTAMQRFTTATRTALVFAMEPVFAALFAFLIAGELLNSLGWIGGGLIICGMIVAEVNWMTVLKR
jgi:drug/metabolite transporter (DMT)-like permease